MLMKKPLLLTTLAGVFAASAGFGQIIVSEDMSSATTLNTGTVADDATLNEFATNAVVPSGDVFTTGSTAWNSNEHLAITGNTEGGVNDGKLQSALTYAFDSTGLTGLIEVSFDLAIVNDGTAGAGDPGSDVVMEQIMWGEVHTWNTANTMEYPNAADNGGYYADIGSFGNGGGPDIRSINAASAYNLTSGTYVTITESFDLGPTGFDHTADGGTPGENILYSSILWGNMSNGDAIYMDNFEVVPEPSTFALLAGFAGLGLVLWRRRRK